jgi:HAD superfamily hydrolase (TIGR01450 family)
LSTSTKESHVPEVKRGLGSSAEPLVHAYDCAMLDLDGVVYIGPEAVDDVPALLERARDEGMSLAFVTNNASRPAPEVGAHLRELGIPAEDHDVVTSAQAAAREILNRCGAGARVLVVGGEGLLWALRERGLEPVDSHDDDPVAVVQGFHPSVGWSQLAEAAAAIRSGALWVASNLDLTFPTPEGPAPGNGALVNAVAAAVGRQPDVVAGKPHRPLFDETVRRVGSKRPLVVGDRLDTDIEGAVRAGADSLLVMTGVTDLLTLLKSVPDQRPTYVAWTMTGLFAAHQCPEPFGGDGWRLDGWEADVRDGQVQVTGEGRDRDTALRVACAAAWAWQDEHGDPATGVNGLEQ